MQTVNPATGKPLVEYVHHDAKEVQRRLTQAQEAFGPWKERSFKERAECFQRLADLFEARADQYGELITSEMGKPITQAKGEVEKCAWVCRHYADNAEAMLRPKPVFDTTWQVYLRYDPVGAVFGVMPWNFPFWQVLRYAAPTMMAGNVAMLKHAESVMGCALALEEAFHDAGFPEGTFTNFIIDHDMVEDCVAHDIVQGVTVTGSTRAGQAMAQHAGRYLKPSVLELGGADPFIVLDDADLEQAVAWGVKARFQNSGQSCIAAKRFLLHEAIAEEYERRFVAAVEELEVGDPRNPDTNVGPMAREDLRTNLERQVADSIDAGARVLTGGKRLLKDGFYYPPTVLARVRPGMPAFDEELFGPVAALTTFASDDEAIGLANQSEYGLSSSVWSTNRSRAQRIGAALETGAVFVNKMSASDPRVPFGGVKTSGYGRELGDLGIHEFVNAKTVWVE